MVEKVLLLFREQGIGDGHLHERRVVSRNRDIVPPEKQFADILYAQANAIREGSGRTAFSGSFFIHFAPTKGRSS